MSIRTLRFGDRTISYDTGLNLAENDGQGKTHFNTGPLILLISMIFFRIYPKTFVCSKETNDTE